MKNRFTQCVSLNEAKLLLRLLQSSEDDKRKKQALQNEFDIFVSIIGGYRDMQFDCVEDILDQTVSNGNYLDSHEKKLVNYPKGYTADDYYDCEDYDEIAEADARDLDGYPPGMTRADLIHVGEIDPDDE